MSAKISAPGGRANSVKVLIVEDCPLIREALLHFIDAEPGLKVSGCAPNGRQAMILLDKLRPDAVVLDVFLDATDGIDLIKRILYKSPSVPILVLSLQDENIYAERVFQAGAKGFLTKKAEPFEIMAAIKAVAGGQHHFSSTVQNRLWTRARSPKGPVDGDPVKLLSDRELHVFQLIGKGVATRAIASRLKISIKTVETYRSNIKQKLLLENGTELVRQAVRWCQERRC